MMHDISVKTSAINFWKNFPNKKDIVVLLRVGNKYKKNYDAISHL